jgi:CheY-like chemotaxis protein
MDKTGSKTILLVEDDVLIAMGEQMTLEQNGYQVVMASSGEGAVKAVETTPKIDLILMDIDLGKGMDGTESAAIILKDRDLPVVFLSSHTEPEMVEKTERITSYGYIVKNSGDTVLLTSIKMAFKLFEANRRYHDTFNYALNGICVHRMIFDESGNPHDCEYLDVNSAFEKHTGLSRDELIGRTIRDIYPGGEAKAVIDLYAVVVVGPFEQFYYPPPTWHDLPGEPCVHTAR